MRWGRKGASFSPWVTSSKFTSRHLLNIHCVSHGTKRSKTPSCPRARLAHLPQQLMLTGKHPAEKGRLILPAERDRQAPRRKGPLS